MTSSLIPRLEAGNGSDRELDGDLFEQFGGDEWEKAYHRAQLPCGCPHDMAVKEARLYAPHYITSLDASLALVERMLPGWGYTINLDPDRGTVMANLYSLKSGGVHRHAYHADAPRALLIALLKALESSK